MHLVDKVSRGGNFLLDIGPDAHGKTPPIMQDRLLDIGRWAQVNGERFPEYQALENHLPGGALATASLVLRRPKVGKPAAMPCSNKPCNLIPAMP
ncbi:MAG: alpha-L-fucosidase [Lewinellaceae bacterium]|nr:alpha-L-fucosidase [Lewinellaceae bacterium]